MAIFKGDTTTFYANYLARQKALQETATIKKQKEKLQRAGIDVPESSLLEATGRKTLGTLNTIFRVLQTGEYAVGGLLAGKGAIEGIKEEITPSSALGITVKKKRSLGDLLKDPNFYVATAVDVILDPLTYLTFGFGSGAKISTELGTKVLNKEGTKFLQGAVKDFGEDAARKMTATKILQQGGEAFVDQGGLKMFGKEIVKRDIVQAPFKGLDSLISSVPKVGEGYKGLKDMFGEKFIKNYQIEKLPALAGGKGRFTLLMNKAVKGARADSIEAAHEIGNIARTAKKELGEDAAAKLTFYREEQLSSGTKAFNDILDWMDEFSDKKIASRELERNILKETKVLPGYMQHVLTSEGKEVFEDIGLTAKNDIVAFHNQFRAKLNTLKARKYVKVVDEATGEKVVRKLEKGEKDVSDAFVATVKDMNEHFRTKYGVKNDMFETDAFKLLLNRKIVSDRNVMAYDASREIAKEFGVVSRKIGGKHEMTRDVILRDGSSVRYIQPKNPLYDGVLLPKAIAHEVDKVTGIFTDPSTANDLLKYYDKALNVFKGSVTGWFPAFHTRNAIGGMFNNWLAGVKDVKLYKISDDIARGKNGSIVTKMGTTYTYDDVRMIAERYGITGQPGIIDAMKNIEEVYNLDAMSGIRKGAKKFSEYPRVAMEFVEDRVRIPLFIDRLKKGDDVEQAVKSVFQYHFDYTPEGLTAFEKNVMKRVLPFYRWTRGNVPLQIMEMAKQPGKYATLAKVRENFNLASGKTTVADEENVLPQWMREMYLFRLPGDVGTPKYLQLDLPIDDLNKLPFTQSGRREIISLLSPFIKYPIEVIGNRNIYYGSEIYDATLPREFQTAKTVETLKYLPDPLKRYLNFKETQMKDLMTGKMATRYEMDARKLHFVRSMFAARYYSTVATFSDDELTAWMKMSRLLSGIPVREVDVEEEKLRRLIEERKTLQGVTTHERLRGNIPTSGR